jgi:tetratricopeptide (TPR) repeat protein
MEVAHDLLRDGLVAEAEEACRSLVSAAPNHADGLHLLGFIQSRGRKLVAAEQNVRKAISLAPGIAQYHNTLGNILLGKGDRGGAELAFRSAINASTNLAEAHHNLGVVLHNSGQRANAVLSLARAAMLQPANSIFQASLATALSAMGKDDVALATIDRALETASKLATLHAQRGRVLIALGRIDDAAEALLFATTLGTADSNAFVALGHALERLDRLMDALAAYEDALRRDPANAFAYACAGGIHLRLEHFDRAAESARRALRLNHELPEALFVLGSALNGLHHTAEAIPLLRKALAARPSFGDAENALGQALLVEGQIDEAVACFERALRSSANQAGIHYNLAHAKRFAEGDQQVSEMETLLQHQGRLPPDQRILLHFALGKAHDDLRHYDEAFVRFAEGSKLKLARSVYDEDQSAEFFYRIKSVFQSQSLADGFLPASRSALPIFIVGMPRSGTTLIEQILASHRDVSAAGEILDLGHAVQALSTGRLDGTAFPEVVGAVDAMDLARVGEDYLGRLGARAPSAVRITDKFPTNFYFIGLIRLVLPGAKIIHCRRDPLDTCFSCFGTLFRYAHEWTYDLGTLGRFYRRYDDLMSFWRSVLPPGSFIDVMYERVVADLEAESRRILEYCALDWDPSCIAFHRTERPVRTASQAQVRRPIYGGSIGRWRNYEKHLAPLIEALGDLSRQS